MIEVFEYPWNRKLSKILGLEFQLLEECVWLYFLFMIIGVLGFIYGYVDTKMLNFLIVASFIILIIGTLPYVRTISQEEKLIDDIIKKIK